MKLNIGIGWIALWLLGGYLARGWDGFFGAMLLLATYLLVVFPLVTAYVRRKYDR